MESLERTLSALKDVRGVEGSLYASREGRIVGRDLPRIFDDDSLDGVSDRIARLLEAMNELSGEHEGTLVRYPNHAMLIRPTPGGLLCVLTTSDVNVPSLKRGASLVARRLPSVPPPLPAPVATTRASSPPARATASVPPRASVPGAPGSPSIRWRGSSVKDG